MTQLNIRKFLLRNLSIIVFDDHQHAKNTLYMPTGLVADNGCEKLTKITVEGSCRFKSP